MLGASLWTAVSHHRSGYHRSTDKAFLNLNAFVRGKAWIQLLRFFQTGIRTL